MRNKIVNCIIITIFMLLLPINVYANSSWVWISETRPYDILPVIIVITLVIETLTISFATSKKKVVKVFTVVAIANLLSFLTPFLINFISAYIEKIEFEYYVNHYPFYIVGIIYLCITILVETPIVYVLLKKDDKNKRLLLTIIISNIITTGIVAITERVLCIGNW